MSQKLDMLAVIDKLTSRYIANRGTQNQFISCVTPEVFGNDTDLRKSDIAAAWLDLVEARAAVAELILSIVDEAAAQAVAAGLGVSEWDSFVSSRTRDILARIGAK